MKKGKVKFFNEMRGFGFITVDETGEEVFVHKSDVRGRIRENDAVEFEIQKGQKGLNAVDVKVIS
jgi:cold shock protein